ncbi:MAG: hypothetical protein PUB22_01805 [Clostridiales bacterium]|nr:hypothetical protein [Clostridiales bacterium]
MEMELVRQELENIPQMPSSGASCRLRFFHAAYGFGAVNIMVEEMQLDHLAFGQMSEFFDIPSGYGMTTISSSQMPQLILYQKNLLYPPGTVVTAAVVNGQEGICVKLIPEV